MYRGAIRHTQNHIYASFNMRSFTGSAHLPCSRRSFLISTRLFIKIFVSSSESFIYFFLISSTSLKSYYSSLTRIANMRFQLLLHIYQLINKSFIDTILTEVFKEPVQNIFIWINQILKDKCCIKIN